MTQRNPRQDEHDDGEFFRLMQDAALLPPGHPDREDVLRAVELADGSVQRRWAQLVQEHEELRLHLRCVAPRDGLERRLFAIADGGRGRSPWWRRRVAVAAVVVMGIAALAFWWSRSPTPSPTLADTTQRLATYAIEDHHRNVALAVESPVRDVVAAGLKGSSPLPARIPEMDRDFTLVGGSTCAFDSRPAVFTRWVRRGTDHSLYQVRLEDFDLPPRFAAQELLTPPTPGMRTGHRVIIWSDGEFAYVLVCERHGDELLKQNG